MKITIPEKLVFTSKACEYLAKKLGITIDEVYDKYAIEYLDGGLYAGPKYVIKKKVKGDKMTIWAYTNLAYCRLGDRDWEYLCSKVGTHTLKLNLCIGGPLTGQMSTENDAGEDYVIFNCGSYYREKQYYRTVLIHKSMVEKG